MSKKIATFPDQNQKEVQSIIDSAPESIKEESYIEVGVRPWGLYYVLEDKPNFKVKKIVVNPNHRLSLQSHKHRSEHWVVVSGLATVEIRNQTPESEWVYDLHPNESCYIKMNTTHRLANYGKIPLVIVEVQVGEYTGEDDIIRYEDDYSRNTL
ncbi:MAG: phosphomannose isomerase type II C-terminal cupin domain [Patescibacteria group bacterium]